MKTTAECETLSPADCRLRRQAIAAEDTQVAHVVYVHRLSRGVLAPKCGAPARITKHEDGTEEAVGVAECIAQTFGITDPEFWGLKT